jgi:hypothetical protein
MTQFKMDDNDDIAIENNTFVLTSNNSDEEIRQRLLQALRFFLGEWFLDTTEGIPYFQTILVKGTPPDIIEAEFKSAILGVEGVASLNEFEPLEYEPATREMKVVFDVTTINGNNLSINEVLP